MDEGRLPSKEKIYSTRTLMLVVILLAASVVLPLLLGIRELTDLDVRLFLESREQYETSFKSFLRVFTELGSLLIWLPIVPVLWLARKKEAAVVLFIALLTVVLFAFSMKYAIDRPRPFYVIEAVDPLYRPFDPSFPSAHAMTAFAGAIAIGKKWRGAMLPLLVLAAAIGFSRVYIGVHYPYDVASGAIIGILIGLVADSLHVNKMVKWIERWLHRLVDRSGISKEVP
jgi:undecaprenyl-diphosphatase